MKNKILLYIILMVSWMPLHSAYGSGMADCVSYACNNAHNHINIGACIPYDTNSYNTEEVSCAGWYHNNDNPQNYQYNVYSCKKCPTGTHLATKYLKDSPAYNVGTLYCKNVNLIAYQTCETDTAEKCSPDNCSTTSWANPIGGYEVRSCCDNGYKVTQYRCKAGYYGNPTSLSSGCTQCPTWTDVYTTSAKTTLARGTSAAGATAVTGCYVAPGTYYDVTGTFKLISNCSYK